MVYHRIGLNISPLQRRKLATGGSIRILPKNMSGSTALHLTASQIKKLQKSQALGKGTTLTMSKSQIKKNGGSLWSTIKKVAKKGYDIAKPFAKNAGRYLVNKGIERITPIIKNKADRALNTVISAIENKVGNGARNKGTKRGKGWFNKIVNVVEKIADVPIVKDIGTKLINKGIEKTIARATNGQGVKKRTKRKATKRGKGWFNKVINTVGKIADVPIVKDIGTKLINKGIERAISGSGRRKRASGITLPGGGILLPGAK